MRWDLMPDRWLGAVRAGSAQVFLIDGSIRDVCDKIIPDLFFDEAHNPDQRPPLISAPACRSAIFVSHHWDQKHVVEFYRTDSIDSVGVVVSQGFVDGSVCVLGCYNPGTPGYGLYIADILKRLAAGKIGRNGLGYAGFSESDLATIAEDHCNNTLPLVAYFWSVVNSPGMSETGVFGGRADRRRQIRSTGVAFRVVRWKVGAGRAGAAHGNTGRKGVPLHFRRGHYRRANSHYKGAMFLERFVADQPPGWFQWIEGQFVGSPEFGVVRHAYAPKLSLGEVRAS